jgi:nucleotide-binding universal stress UspA family protein
MYTLLVPTDDSDQRCQEQAAFVADLPGDPDDYEILLTHVLEGAKKEAPQEMQRPDRVETVRNVRGFLEERGHEVTVVEATPPPAEGILELADERDVDLIVMGGRKQSPAGKVLFGSVTQSVILDSDRPVTVTGCQPED